MTKAFNQINYKKTDQKILLATSLCFSNMSRLRSPELLNAFLLYNCVHCIIAKDNHFHVYNDRHDLKSKSKKH